MNVARLVRVTGILPILLWTGLSVGVYALLGAGADWLAGNTDWLAAHPDVRYWFAWALRFSAQFGEVAIIVIWAVGALVLALLMWLGPLAWRRLVEREGRRPDHNL
jgi:hypothetical protein